MKEKGLTKSSKIKSDKFYQVWLTKYAKKTKSTKEKSLKIWLKEEN